MHELQFYYLKLNETELNPVDITIPPLIKMDVLEKFTIILFKSLRMIKEKPWIVKDQK